MPYSSGGGGVTIGGTVVGGTNNTILYINGSGALSSSTSLAYNDSGAGNGVFTFLKTMSGAATTSNFFNATGTLPATLTAAANAVNFQFTGAGSSAQALRGLNVDVFAGYTGNQYNAAVRGVNASAGTGAIGAASVGGYFEQSAGGSAARVGVLGIASGTSTNYEIGAYGKASNTTGFNFGVVGEMNNTATVGYGGFFLSSAIGIPTTGTAILGASNGAGTKDIFHLLDNITLVHSVQDGGTATYSMGGATHTALANALSVLTTGTTDFYGESNSASGYAVQTYNSNSGVRAYLGATGASVGGGNHSAAVVYTSTAHPILFSTNTSIRDYIEDANKALTAGAATPFVRINVAAGAIAGGTITYTIRADDGTDFQSRSGILVFSIVNKAGTLTCTLGRPDGGTTVDDTTDILAQSSASTLTNTFTSSNVANAVDIKATAASGLTETTLNIGYRVTLNNSGAATVTPQ